MNDKPIITPDVVVWVHPINEKEHPTYRPGFRWAVHVGMMAAGDLKFCCQAGRADTKEEARIVGESYGAAMCKAIRMFGVPARYSVNELAWDPIPAVADTRPTEVWNGMWKGGSDGFDC
jgi:hypothetical protein